MKKAKIRKKAKKTPKKKIEKFDGITPKNIERIRRVMREVWYQSSNSRKICIARATDKEGFGHCELCTKKVPKLLVDHIKEVGQVDAGFLARLWCHSSGLQAICRKCHTAKTAKERKDLRIKKALELNSQTLY